MKDFGNFGNALFEDAKRRRIGDHERGDVFGNEFAKFFDVDLAVRFGLDVFDLVAGDDGGRGIRSVRGVGNQNFLAGVALFFEVGANQQQAGEFALRARGGLQSDGVHAGDFEEALLQKTQDFQAALRELLRLQRVLGRDAVEACDEFIYARVVFHGAGTERIHAEVDRVIPRGEAREMAEDFDFADFWETLDAFGAQTRAQGFRWIGGRDIQRWEFECALAGRGFLEDQAFVLARMARCFFDFSVHQGSRCCIV